MPLPPEGSDLGLDMIESQCAATCAPGTINSLSLHVCYLACQ